MEEYNNKVNDPFNDIPNTNPTEFTVCDEIYSPNIPKIDSGYIENETITLQGQAPVTVKYKIPPKPTKEHQVKMWDKINEFENKAWSPKNKGLKSGWESIDKAFDGGIKSGFIVVAGDSNLGKSAFMSQLAWQIATNNRDTAYVMDFSLDDPTPDKLARIIGAGSKVLLNAVKSPVNYTHLPLMLARRKKGLNELREHVNCYASFDATETTFIEDIEEKVLETKISLDAAGEDRTIVVLIDNLHDLNIKEHPNYQDKQKYDFIAQWAADLAIKFDIPVICTAELKKLNSNRRPALDDIREAVKIKYEAKAILLVYNEVHYKAEAADVYYLTNGNNLKQPVFEVHFAKNKIHSYKGRCFFEFFPDMARLEESDEESTRAYNGLIFGS